MGNYTDLELDFVERTISLIEQYTNLVQEKPFAEQLNYTLTINCLLGLVVMPKERIITYISKEKLSAENLQKMGLFKSRVDDSIKTLRDLIKNLRHAIAHFSIEVISECDKRLIDRIVFKGAEGQAQVIADFRAQEIFPFLQYYANSLIENMRMYRA
ncbi:HEPN family nuclease [Metapseudomonas otitidis]|uniref:HEPN family nuclease n=1 Tax=Metapseudomonas otitidis TaxID=319939 RepID=UPI00405577AA